MKQKLLALALAVCLLASLLPQGILPAHAEATVVPYAVEGGNLYFDKETGTITDCDKTVTYAAIPDEIDGIAVTSIGYGAFLECASLTGLTIPNSVTTIGISAFSSCDSLIQVTIPDSVTMIGKFAFAGCNRLTGMTIPDSVVSIGSSAFILCTSLTSVTIPDSVTAIGRETFQSCYSLTSVRIPDSVTTIGDNAFDSCTSLTSVCFMGDAPQVGEDVFSIWVDNHHVNNPNLTIYYIEGNEGWTTPEWYGYPAAPWHPFSDLKSSSWYYDAVMYAVSHGIFNGNTDGTFGPGNPMTRAMLVTTLHRLAGEPAPKAAAAFSDVDAARYYAKPVAWAAENGIVNGMGDNKFQPNTNVTREQAATFLYRYATYAKLDTTARADLSKFHDAGKVSNFAKDSLSWANAEGLINGKKNTQTGVISLDPKGSATRAELAKILMSFMENVVK